MNRIISSLLIVIIGCGTVFAATAEVSSRPNFWTEFDITFWQTFPFAAFWGYLAASQVSPGAVNWSPVMSFALAVSAGNAFFRARRVTNLHSKPSL